MKVLTFDIEEWFHLLDNPSTRFESQWTGFSSRIDQNVDRILKILDKTNISATFFCLGWIAEKYPHIVKKISDLGYEIACHSHTHQLAYTQTPKDFREDLKRAKSTIEDVIGYAINTYRIPGFSLTKENLWVFDIIHEEGFSVDCSVFPASRSHGGFKNFITDQPCLIELDNLTLIKEFPLNTSSVLGNRLVFSGGGYFRLLPYSVLRELFSRSHYVMTYFHPRDFDDSQPMISGLSLIRRFKSYFGLKYAEDKLVKLLNEFDFMDVRTAVKSINWESVEKIKTSSLHLSS
jgi:polysaccharide deacetylase family protein (PEP-CTERM system associated)